MLGGLVVSWLGGGDEAAFLGLAIVLVLVGLLRLLAVLGLGLLVVLVFRLVGLVVLLAVVLVLVVAVLLLLLLCSSSTTSSWVLTTSLSSMVPRQPSTSSGFRIVRVIT